MFMFYGNSSIFLSHVQYKRFIFRFRYNLLHTFHRKMKQKFNYEESIEKLNKLTSNAATIKEGLVNQIRQKEIKRDNTLRYLEYTGYNLNDLNKLSVIHIAGTKGKGSTSAMCESILRNHGYKTGFFSSPHLLSVTERIKINGKSIQEEQFAQVFSNIYQQLKNNGKHEGDMPPYFGFLTVMALNIFINEQVDVAIIEVGIGGEYDQTNIVRNVPVVGITSLGFDHTNLLGKTIKEIAKQKAGIMKPGSKAYTVEQSIEAMEVLQETASAKKCSLTIVPDYESYNWFDIIDNTNLRLTNPTKYLNASLAIQLAHSWMKYKDSYCAYSQLNVNDNTNYDIIKNVPLKTFMGIESSFWPGRCQTLNLNNEDYYIDGAHTIESMSVCTKWFKHQSRKSSFKVLIFHLTGDRDPEPLLKMLLNCDFDLALFAPNIAYDETTSKNSADQVCTNIEVHEQLEICRKNKEVWSKLVSEYQPNVKEPKICTFDNISSAFDHLSSIFSLKSDIEKPQILITGSLLLVGAALTVLDPLLTNCK